MKRVLLFCIPFLLLACSKAEEAQIPFDNNHTTNTGNIQGSTEELPDCCIISKDGVTD